MTCPRPPFCWSDSRPSLPLTPRPVSYLLHIGPAAEAGITIEDAQNVLVAVAPIIGTARVMSAAINIAEALELAIAVIEEDSE